MGELVDTTKHLTRATGNIIDNYRSKKKYTEQIQYSCPKGNIWHFP